MTKGTASRGPKHNKTHTLCRRCGRRSFHIQKKSCGYCGYPAKKMRKFNWSMKAKRRRGNGTGRMRYLKTIKRKEKNGFRSGTQAKSQKTTAAMRSWRSMFSQKQILDEMTSFFLWSWCVVLSRACIVQQVYVWMQVSSDSLEFWLSFPFQDPLTKASLHAAEFGFFTSLLNFLHKIFSSPVWAGSS